MGHIDDYPDPDDDFDHAHDESCIVMSASYRWAECTECGISLRVPVWDRDEPICSGCAYADLPW